MESVVLDVALSQVLQAPRVNNGETSEWKPCRCGQGR